jgi:DNA-binding response OmpR family regulator
MPKKHGIDAIREIKTMDQKAKIIAITALYSPEKRKKVMEAGAAALVVKPFDVPDLIKAIEKVLSV